MQPNDTTKLIANIDDWPGNVSSTQQDLKFIK